MKVIIGLGNPTSRYFNTFHNLGFMAVDRIAEVFNVRFDKKECRALTCHFIVEGEKVILAKPQTFMNLSGECVRDLVQKYKPDLKEVLIICDDFDLERARLRVRPSGSAGTHNGMRNVVECLGATEFPRIRIGIGSSENHAQDKADYVLSKIPAEERDDFERALDKAAEAAKDFIMGLPMEELMQKYNGEFNQSSASHDTPAS